jgi:hypothetical protein
MLRMINPVEQENGEIPPQGGVKSYPCESVLVWKLLAKVSGLSRGERCQRGPAMVRDEGAGQQYSGGWRFGLSVARTPALTVKRESRSLSALPASRIRLPWQASRVMRVATWRKRLHLQTIELPQRSRLGGITAAHKAVPKWLRYALERRTNSLRPAPQGTQQDQSKALCAAGVLTDIAPCGCRLKGPSPSNSRWPARATGIVSRAVQAAFGPGRASSRLNLLQAKQHSSIVRALLAAVVIEQTGET